MWIEMSNPAILGKLGSRIKDIRIRREMTQKELAEQAGISLLTVINMEKGKTVTTPMLISVFRALDILENLEYLVPEPKISPILLKKLQGNKRYRVRHITNKDNE